jgi:nitrogen fixation protein FixH
MTMNASNSRTGTDHTTRQRELTGRMVLLCLVAFFGVVGAANAVLVGAALSTFGGLETASSYQAGLSFAREVAAAQEQQARHWHVNAKLNSDAGGATQVELSARDASDRPLTGIAAAVSLTHPTYRRLDRSVAMQPAGPGLFRGTATAAPGQWDIVIELTRAGERLFRSKERVILR